MATFAARVQELRKEQLGEASSKVDLAFALRTRFPDAMGTMTEKTVSSWEKGGAPRWGHALLLAEFFGVSLSYLNGDDNERGSPPKSSAGEASAPTAERSDLSDEVAEAGDARRPNPRPSPRRSGSKRHSAP